MSANSYEPMMFDLEEKIVFRQGEEIDDLYGISIQPDIRIFKELTHIQLRGVLIVSGEYETIPNHDPVYLIDDDQDENYVQQVKAMDNGFTTFNYPIPVDITIPSNRIRETNNPEVHIEYFDYELPEPKTLHIFAKIRLDGVQLLPEEEREFYQPDFELKAIPSIDERQEEVPNSDEDVAEPNFDDVATNQDESNEDEKGRDFWKKETTHSFAEFLQKKEEKAMSSEDDESVSETTSESEEAVETTVEASTVDAEYEEDEVTQEDADQSEEKPKKGLSYLASLFRNKEGQPEKVQLKIRFVQENETIDSIAEAYDISVAKLERLNNLESGYELQSGELLYVPYKETKSS